jgi:hypothetical protein
MLWPIAQPALALLTGAGSPSGEALRRLSVAIPRPVEERQSPLVCDEWLWHSGENFVAHIARRAERRSR